MAEDLDDFTREAVLANYRTAQETIRVITENHPDLIAPPADQLPTFKTKMEVSDYLLGKGLDRRSDEYREQFQKLAVNLPTF